MPETRFTSLRNAFLTGLLLVAPLAATIYLIKFVIGLVGGSITPLFAPYLPASLQQLPGLFWDVGITLVALALVTGLGYISHLFLGQVIGAVAERLIQSVPGIGGFYNSVRQFIETFGAKDRTQFSKVVLVQFPRAGAYTIGFLTNTGRGEPHTHFTEERWAVFVPTCPSPVNGFFVYLPVTEIIELHMSVGEGMKIVISCGAVLPHWTDASAAKTALENRG
jgi:uncharacterized membrane protein